MNGALMLLQALLLLAAHPSVRVTTYVTSIL